MNLLKQLWIPALIILLIVGLSLSVSQCRNEHERAEREHSNFMESQKLNATLVMTPAELKKYLVESTDRTARHTDSLFKANKINPKGVEESHNIVSNYYKKDSTILIIPATSKLIPIEEGDKCWGFSGLWSNNKLIITERRSHAEIDLIDYAKPKKFLFFRIGWKDPKLEAFTDCGTVTVKSYKRAKK